jgi:predicted lipoprotein with Yx(FWY)xxD motif
MGVRGAAGAALILSMIGLAACSSSGDTSAGGGAATGSAAPPPSSAASSSAPAGAALETESSSLGTILVDDQKMTVYIYTKDTPNSGKSTCTGQCASAWPEVTTDSASPSVTGISGKVGTIKGVDGKTQLTINGWPLYTFASDSGPGDVNGQGVGGVWWVVGADGKKITKTAPSSGSDNGGY